MSTTVRDIIKLALKDAGVVGVGQSPLAEDTNDAFTKLNWMISQWQRKRWIIYHLVDLALTSTGAQTYTVGPTGDFVTSVRPDKLEAAFFRQLINSQPNQVDYPLTIIPSREDYSRIALKKLQTFPQAIFYDAGYPNGTIYPWPVPQSVIYEIHLVVKSPLQSFANLSDVVNLPEEYYSAIHLNLVVRLWAQYGMQPDPNVLGLARDALNVIRGANTQISTLTMPADVMRDGHYNIYSDQTY